MHAPRKFCCDLANSFPSNADTLPDLLQGLLAGSIKAKKPNDDAYVAVAGIFQSQTNEIFEFVFEPLAIGSRRIRHLHCVPISKAMRLFWKGLLPICCKFGAPARNSSPRNEVVRMPVAPRVLVKPLDPIQQASSLHPPSE